jgi:lipopolysaccharide export system protein LptA
MKKFLILSMISLSLFSNNLEITSKSFTYNEARKISTFIKDVNVTRGMDNILCDKMDIFFNDKKKPIKIVALNDVRFQIKVDTNSTYKGKSNKLVYLIPEEKIDLEGNVSIKKIEDDQRLYGEKVIIDKKNKTANVIGNDKPIKFIIKVND